jgi:ribose transport system ATP-binding protein
MMGNIETPHERNPVSRQRSTQALVVDHGGMDDADLPIKASPGEIIGFAGLDGHGQRERLRAIYAATRKVPVAFVAGDRGTEGVMPLWSIADNLTIRSLNALQNGGFVSRSAARRLAKTWLQRLKVKAPSIDTPILSLSGGNQQKVLFARALASDGQVILLDDPMRGVDVGTKQEVYQLIRDEAERGRIFIWYTTEFEELKNCDRLYVFRENRAVAEVPGDEIDHNRILEASFGGANG